MRWRASAAEILIDSAARGDELGAPPLDLAQQLLAESDADGQSGFDVEGVLSGGADRVQQEVQMVSWNSKLRPMRRGVM